MITRTSILAAVLACASLSAAAEDVALSSARALGAEVAHASARAEAGDSSVAAEVDKLQRTLMDVSRNVDPASEAGAKLQATARALSMLQQNTTAPTSRSAQRAPTRDGFILERVAANHGSSCGNAMGLSLDKPSRLTLGSGGDAWFYASATTATTLRIATQSHGPDPALEIVEGCSPGAAKLGANDDSFGLDAAVTAPVDDHQTVFVHLTNRGEGGEVNVVLTTSTATITGKVIDAKTGLPITNAAVQIFATDGSYFYGWATTDGNGNYTLTPGSTGTVYIGAYEPGYVAQVYQTGYCKYGAGTFLSTSVCDVSHARAITIPASGTVKNVNFALSAGARLSGQVRSTNNDPLQANLQIMGANVYSAAYITADAAGHYAFTALPPGTYYVQAADSSYITQLWNHVDCPVQYYVSCDTSNATPITVGSADVANINFDLQLAATIQGTVSSASTSSPLNYNAYVSILNQSGSFVAQAYVDSSGHYASSGLPLGTYYVYVDASGFFSQLYDMLDCTGPCSSQYTSGTPLTISANGQQVEADFVLTPYPSLQGHITDAVTSAPLANAQVLVTTSPNSGTYLALSGITDATGKYVVASIQPATFYVWAQSPDHVDQIYNGITCEDPDGYYLSGPHCDVSTATTVTSSHSGLSQAVVDFALQPSSSISGHLVERAGPGSDLVPLGVQVTLYDGTNAAVAVATADVTGNYALTDLAPGTYYAVASSSYSSEQYVGQMWQDIDCPTNCAPTTGTPITVPASTAVTGIDFQLARVNGVVGRVVDPNGDPIRGVVVDLFNVSDHSYAAGTGTDALGYFAVAANTGGSYYVATEAGGSYIDQVYSGISCPSGTAYDGKCSLTGATAVTLGGASAQPVVIDFTLQIGDRVFSNGFE